MAAADPSVAKGAGREILTDNAGSSSVRFALYRRADPPSRIFRGKVDRIGLPDAYLAFEEETSSDMRDLLAAGSTRPARRRGRWRSSATT